MASQPIEPIITKENDSGDAPEASIAHIIKGEKGIECQSLDDAYRMAQWIIRSQFCPMVKDKDKNDVPMTIGDVVICIVSGSEVGLGAMQSIQNIAPINGRPTLWGDALLGVCQASRVFDHKQHKEWFEGEGDSLVAKCQVARIGADPYIYAFSDADRKKAKLGNVHGTYPKRMLQMRARGFALRDKFADVLRGLCSAEEQLDLATTLAMVETADEPPAEPKTQDDFVAGLSATTEASEGQHTTHPADSAAGACAELRGELRLTMKALDSDSKAAQLIDAQGLTYQEIGDCCDPTLLQSCIDLVRYHVTAKQQAAKEEGKTTDEKTGDGGNPAMSKTGKQGDLGMKRGDLRCPDAPHE